MKLLRKASLVFMVMFAACDFAPHKWVEKQLAELRGDTYTHRITGFTFLDGGLVDVFIDESVLPATITVQVGVVQGFARLTPKISFVGSAIRWEAGGTFGECDLLADGTATTSFPLDFSEPVHFFVRSLEGGESEYIVNVICAELSAITTVRPPSYPVYARGDTAFDINKLREGLVIGGVYSSGATIELPSDIDSPDGYDLSGYDFSANNQNLDLQSIIVTSRISAKTCSFNIYPRDSYTKEIVIFRFDDIGVSGRILNPDIDVPEGIIELPVPDGTDAASLTPFISHTGAALYYENAGVWTAWPTQGVGLNWNGGAEHRFKVVSSDNLEAVYKAKISHPVASRGSGNGIMYYNTLKDAVLKASGSPGNADIITLLENINLTETLIVPASKNIALTTEFAKEKTITRADSFTDSLFTVEGGASLALGSSGSLLVDGGTEVSAPLITVNGIFALNNGAVLQNNKTDSSTVLVTGSGSSFTMNGGKIRANESTGANGSTVCVSDHGSFVLEEGDISGNTSLASIVRIEGAVFTMNDGRISANTVGNAAVVMTGVTGVTGTTAFNMHGGLITGTRFANGGNAAAVFSGNAANDTLGFTMSGSAVIAPNNIVMLNNTGKIRISGTLTPQMNSWGNYPYSARIAVSTYNNARQVLEGDLGLSGTNTNSAKFTVVPQNEGSASEICWMVDANGFLINSVCTRLAEAAIIPYTSLSNAIAACPSGTSIDAPDVITVLQNITLTERIILENGKYIALHAPNTKDVTIKRGVINSDLFEIRSQGSLELSGSSAGKQLIIDGNKSAAIAPGFTGFYISGGTVIVKDNVLIKDFKRSGTQGGGAFFIGTDTAAGTLVMEGGTISGCEASSAGKAVKIHNGDMKMGGSALITTDNDVLFGNNIMSIFVSYELTHAVAACITPNSYGQSIQVLSGEVSANYTKFAITNSGNHIWRVNDTGYIYQAQ
jgi:hypothetical protein